MSEKTARITGKLIDHPKGLILHELKEAGVPDARLHDTAARIIEAYVRLNGPGRIRYPDMTPGEGVEL